MKNRLHHQLQNAQNNGFAIIPLVGGSDLTSGKKPAVNWKKYQATLPTPVEMQQWFEHNTYSAYGIVCGLVSGLVVLDFDDTKVFLKFAAHFPQLLHTQIVQTRRGFHVYWRVNFPVQGRQFPSADLKGDGGYVVGPGSTIGKVTWTIVQDHPITAITPTQLDQVTAFLAPSVAMPEPPMPPKECLATPEDAVQLYQANVQRHHGQRNKALYQTACELRDRGYTEAWTCDAIVETHVWQPSLPNHAPETPERRYQESYATIKSAYRHPPSPLPKMTGSRLPNGLREAILQVPNGATALRLLEWLNLEEVEAGASLTVHTVEERLAGRMNRANISVGLRIKLPSGVPIFKVKRLESTFARFWPTEQSTLCSTVREEGLSASQGVWVARERGYFRPPVVYEMPNIADLWEELGVKSTYGDAIYADDLTSNAAYRAALNQKLIKRRKGQYSQTWLARRLHVSERTIRRYIKDDPHLHSAPSYVAAEVYDTILGRLPYSEDWPSEYTGGRFLMSAKGKRFPCKREIAERFLKAHSRIWLVEQRPNLYWYAVDDKTPPEMAGYRKVQNGMLIEQPKKQASKEAKSSHLTKESQSSKSSQTHPLKSPSPHQAVKNIPVEQPAEPVSKSVETDPQTQASTPAVEPPPLMYVLDVTPSAEQRLEKRRRLSQQREYRQPLSSEYLETAAQATYQKINAIATPGHALSLANARRLVDTFGAGIVRKQTEYILKLHQRGKVHNLVGLLITNIEASWVYLNQKLPFDNDNPFPPRREFTGQPKRRSRQAFPEDRKPYNFEEALQTNPIYRDETYLRGRLELARETDDIRGIYFWEERLARVVYANFLNRLDTDPTYQDETYLRWRLELAYQSQRHEDIRFWYGRLVRLGFEPIPPEDDDRHSRWLDAAFVEEVKQCQYEVYAPQGVVLAVIHDPENWEELPY